MSSRGRPKGAQWMQWIQKFEGIFHVIYLYYVLCTILKPFYYYLLVICDFGGRFAIFYDFLRFVSNSGIWEDFLGGLTHNSGKWEQILDVWLDFRGWGVQIFRDLDPKMAVFL